MEKRLEVRKEKLSEFWQISSLIPPCVCPTCLFSDWSAPLQLAHWQHDPAGLKSRSVSPDSFPFDFSTLPPPVLLCSAGFCCDCVTRSPSILWKVKALPPAPLALLPLAPFYHLKPAFLCLQLWLWPVFKINPPDHNNEGFLPCCLYSLGLCWIAHALRFGIASRRASVRLGIAICVLCVH